ncbi:hypothetical protein PsYK624_049370 [Phanerochaete sordida]|uniref:Uncharacterized protein n=1 Tax=Phanerochaete sordida TaxID=48140 RepID=A0A9P3G6R6_9APHY|nr:hypothetical protein PsYK624_049370 [Phanerochaete sordida]
MLRKLLDGLGRYRKPRKQSSTTCLPPEVIHVILLTYSEGRPFSSQEKRTLSQYSLTCKHWATVLRPLLFQHLVLKSREDILTLLALPRSVIELVSTVDLAIGPSLPEKPWLHYARKLKHINDSVTIRLLALHDPGSWRPTSGSTIPTVLGNHHIEMEYAMLDSLPPLVPAWTLCITELYLYGLQLASVAVVSRLVAQLQTVRSCSCRDVSFAILDSATPLLALRPGRAAYRRSMQDLEVTSSGCTIGSAALLQDNAPDHSDLVSSSILVSVRCAPDLADAWTYTTSLLPRLCNTCVYDYAKVCFVSGGGGSRAIEQYSTCDILLEASFTLDPQGDISAAIDFLLTVSSGLVEDIESHLDWSALGDAFTEESPFGDLIIQTSNIKWATYLDISDDTLEQPIQRAIKYGRVRVKYQSTHDFTAASAAVEAHDVTTSTYSIVTKLGNLRPRFQRGSLEPSHEPSPDPNHIGIEDALSLVSALATAGSLVNYYGSIIHRNYSATSMPIPTTNLRLHEAWPLTVCESSRAGESAEGYLKVTSPALTRSECARIDDETRSIPVSESPPSYHSFCDYGDAISRELPGIIVPQQDYRPPADQSTFDRLASIPFVHAGRPGVRLTDALRLPIWCLDGAQSQPKLSAGGRVALHILWPGYAPWCRHNAIDIFEHVWEKKPVTLERVAQRVATLIRKFCEEKSYEKYHASEPSWKLDTELFKRLYLIELRHVSIDSWQPVICRDVS